MIFNGIIITMHCIGAQPETCLQIQVAICLAVDKVTVSGLLFSYLLSGTNAFTNLSKRPCKQPLELLTFEYGKVQQYSYNDYDTIVVRFLVKTPTDGLKMAHGMICNTRSIITCYFI
ncbi:unnamed protein product [Rhizophagus irregularis]|nr:unnamed protein product [Rhizophagus irregularis]